MTEITELLDDAQVTLLRGSNPLRLASEAPYPYRSNRAPFILLTLESGEMSIGQTPREKRELLFVARHGDLILSVWPGEWRSDVFIIDDWDVAREELARR